MDQSSYNYLPDKYVIPYYSDDILKKYLDTLEKYTTKKNKPIPNNFIIFDDVIGSLKNSDLFKQFIAMYRKYNTWCFIASQYASYVNTLAREQITYAFIFKQQTKNAFEMIYEAIGQAYTKDEFKEVLNEATKEKYSCLLYIADEEDGKQYHTYIAPEKIPSYTFEY
jgi:hypothetical protein